MIELETLNPHKRYGLRRVVNAVGYSLEGLGSAFKHESAFRQELLLACLLIPLAAILPVGLLGAALMITSVFLVLIVELMNSAVEWVVDYISLEKHPYAKRAKDMASGAVFLALTNAVVIWVLVLAYRWEAVSARVLGFLG
jgi:diacylglycerol kinase (ATP)